MINQKLAKIWYGGDYNPEQWPESIWQEDMRLFKLAGVDAVSVNVFGWGRLQPAEDQYEFEWLDKVMDMLHQHEIVACLGTATAVYPSWMGRQYSDLQRVDFQGRKRKYGGRANFCPNSPNFHRFASKLVTKIADRYKDHPALALWHISNEYNGQCYCEHCEKAFRSWLRRKYDTVDAVNRAWNMEFWNQLYYEWEDIVSPTETTVYWGEEKSGYSGLTLDYMRFQSDSLLDCFLMEKNILRKATPEMPITTNFMRWKELDYRKWAQHLDVVSFDNYPRPNAHPASSAFWHDLMRGLKGGKPFMLLEQAPNYAQWMDYNPPKRPGVMRLLSYQAVARGSDSVMFFQMRQSRGAGEKMHGAVISHAGHEHTRTFREVTGLGEELQQLGDTFIDSRIQSKVAILLDWENWWAAEMCVGPSKDIKYMEQMMKYYKAFYRKNIPVDIIHPDDDFSNYSLIVSPMLYMVREGLDQKLESFVEHGGNFVTTFFSGYINETDTIEIGGYPGKLRKLLGIWVEESDILTPDNGNTFILNGKSYDCGLMCDIVHPEAAEPLAYYEIEYYAGTPALTCNHYGEGDAWYVATDPEESFVEHFINSLAERTGVSSLLEAPSGVEVTMRVKDGRQFTFMMNHNDTASKVQFDAAYTDLISGKVLSGEYELEAYGVYVLAKV